MLALALSVTLVQLLMTMSVTISASKQEFLGRRLEQMGPDGEDAETLAADRGGGAGGGAKGGPRNFTWYRWPAVAYEEVGHPLVTKGDTFFHHAREHFFAPRADGTTLMDDFLAVYAARPDKTNLCGIRVNHAMALFLGVRRLRPSLVVESGVNAGQSTYFIRAASNTTRIFAIDPLEKPICNQQERWIDASGLTTYFTGETFVDLVDLDWKGMIERKEVDPARTLVFLDDHLHVYDRIQAMMQHGIRHFICEDNYKAGEGALFVMAIV